MDRLNRKVDALPNECCAERCVPISHLLPCHLECLYIQVAFQGATNAFVVFPCFWCQQCVKQHFGLHWREWGNNFNKFGGCGGAATIDRGSNALKLSGCALESSRRLSLPNNFGHPPASHCPFAQA